MYSQCKRVILEQDYIPLIILNLICYKFDVNLNVFHCLQVGLCKATSLYCVLWW